MQMSDAPNINANPVADSIQTVYSMGQTLVQTLAYCCGIQLSLAGTLSYELPKVSRLLTDVMVNLQHTRD